MTQAERDKQMFKAGWTLGFEDGRQPILNIYIYSAEKAWDQYNQDRAPGPRPKSKKSLTKPRNRAIVLEPSHN